MALFEYTFASASTFLQLTRSMYDCFSECALVSYLDGMHWVVDTRDRFVRWHSHADTPGSMYMRHELDSIVIVNVRHLYKYARAMLPTDRVHLLAQATGHIIVSLYRDSLTNVVTSELTQTPISWSARRMSAIPCPPIVRTMMDGAWSSSGFESLGVAIQRLRTECQDLLSVNTLGSLEVYDDGTVCLRAEGPFVQRVYYYHSLTGTHAMPAWQMVPQCIFSLNISLQPLVALLRSLPNRVTVQLILPNTDDMRQSATTGLYLYTQFTSLPKDSKDRALFFLYTPPVDAAACSSLATSSSPSSLSGRT